MLTLTTMERNNLVEGMDLNEDHDLNFYDECVYGKHHCTPFLLSVGSHAEEILGLVHINPHVVPWQHLMEGQNISTSLMISLRRHLFIP
jgi:hypothetical protein